MDWLKALFRPRPRGPADGGPPQDPATQAVRALFQRLDGRGGGAPAMAFAAPTPGGGGGRPHWFVRLLVVGFLLAVGLPFALTLAWRVFDPPFTWLMVERLGEGEDLSRRPTDLDDISPHLVRAVIAAEDARFCAHDGFDLEAIQRAMTNNAKGRRIRGGSTISQQTAKNVFLWADRSWLRKGLEAYFTVWIEALWPKRRIMEAYLNAAEWGDGRFGAEAAAQALFGKSAKDLTAREAARLAAVLPSPNKWRADNPGPYVRRRAATILSRMQAVRAQGLDLCVLDPDAPAPRETPDRRRPAPLPDLPPLPPPPELGPEADPLADTPQLAPLATVGSDADPAPAAGQAPPESAPSEAAPFEGDPLTVPALEDFEPAPDAPAAPEADPPPEF